MITLKSFVGGEWQEGSGEPAVLVNPSTEEPLAQTSTEGVDFAGAVRHAREVGGPALRAMTLGERASLLKAMSKALLEHRDELLDMSMRNGGNTKSDAKFDVDGAGGALAAYAHLGKGLGDSKIMRDGDGVSLARDGSWWGQHVLLPKEGVAVLINAFNFPAWGFGEKAACALLAGVPVIVKPATSTALVTWRMVEVLDQAGILPPGSVQLVAGSPGDLLSHLREQDVLAFTGSADTGLYLRSRDDILSRNVTVNIEADSLNSAILAPGVPADSDTYGLFLKDLFREMTQKAGQKCTAIRRIFVAEEDMERVAGDLVGRLADVTVGNTADPEVRMGPVSTARSPQRGPWPRAAQIRSTAWARPKGGATTCGRPSFASTTLGLPTWSTPTRCSGPSRRSCRTTARPTMRPSWWPAARVAWWPAPTATTRTGPVG
jgi:oxepin-CoA hydrolase/3-oxo-5,6-dehydrosuberyl-CoA semialdehyde dehydrogenase